LSAQAQNFSTPEGPSAVPVQVASFQDPGSPDPGTAFTASINWGNGVTTPGTVAAIGIGSYTVTGKPPYADEGTFTATTTIFEQNDPTFTISVSSTATVTEADTFTGGLIVIPPGGLIEGQSFSGPVATFTNPGYPTNPIADFTASIAWGDGTNTTGILSGPVAGVYTISGAHTFAEQGTTPISATVADDAPGTDSLTISGPVVVADARSPPPPLPFPLPMGCRWFTCRSPPSPIRIPSAPSVTTWRRSIGVTAPRQPATSLKMQAVCST
jgi:hypothetical protein